ncbi:10382_t:CDS:2, partial [Ambispora leptoticha]
IPTKKGRLSTTEHYQLDLSDLSKVIILLFINETSNNDDKMSAIYILENLDLLIKNKEYTNILTGPTTAYLDETYGYKRSMNISEYFDLHKTKFIVLFLVIAIFILAFLGTLIISNRAKARAKATGEEPVYKESENFIIFQLGIALFRFGTFTTFVIVDSKAIPYLFVPCVAFLVIPTVINLFIAFWILFSGQSQNYVGWFARNGRDAVIVALLSGTNIDALLMLKSCFAGLDIFNAPFNDSSLKRIFWGACAEIIFSEIPQFIIQILYINSSVLLGPIPIFTSASLSLSILTSVISKIYFIRFKEFSPYLSRFTEEEDKNSLQKIGILNYAIICL